MTTARVKHSLRPCTLKNGVKENKEGFKHIALNELLFMSVLK